MATAIDTLRATVSAMTDQELIEMFVYFEPPNGEAGAPDYVASAELIADEIERRGLDT